MRRQQSFLTVLVGKSILLREGLARILRSANFRILASVSSVDDLLPGQLQAHQPLFLIVHTGDDFDTAIEQIELFKDYQPDGRIAIVADHYRMEELASAFRAGANGYFVNVMTCDVFIKSIELMMMGETIFPPAFLSSVLAPEGSHPGEVASRDQNKTQAILVATEDTTTPQLSPREKSILHCLIEGASNKSIARKIHIAEATVKVHVKAILRKLRVQNRTQAAIWGMNNGSLTEPANSNSPPSASDSNGRLSNPVAMISKVEKIAAPVPLGVINHEPNDIEVSRIDRLIRKGINGKICGTVRFGK
jgi:two-component system nitrate/nitrite response regulator NarL